MLSEHAWKVKYTLEDGDLVKRFYPSALEDAARYYRLTGYSRASALALDDTLRAKFQSWYPGLFHVRTPGRSEYDLAA